MPIERFNLIGRRSSAASLCLKGCFLGQQMAEVVTTWRGEETDHWITTVHTISAGKELVAEFHLFFKEGTDEPISIDIIRHSSEIPECKFNE